MQNGAIRVPSFINLCSASFQVIYKSLKNERWWGRGELAPSFLAMVVNLNDQNIGHFFFVRSPLRYRGPEAMPPLPSPNNNVHSNAFYVRVALSPYNFNMKSV